jgi:hypothetical protein
VNFNLRSPTGESKRPRFTGNGQGLCGARTLPYMRVKDLMTDDNIGILNLSTVVHFVLSFWVIYADAIQLFPQKCLAEQVKPPKEVLKME